MHFVRKIPCLFKSKNLNLIQQNPYFLLFIQEIIDMTPLRLTTLALDPHLLRPAFFFNLFSPHSSQWKKFRNKKICLDALFVNLPSIEAILSLVIFTNVPQLCFTEGWHHTVITQSAFIQPFQCLKHLSFPSFTSPSFLELCPLLSLFLSLCIPFFLNQKNGYNILLGLGVAMTAGVWPETDGGQWLLLTTPGPCDVSEAEGFS